MNKLDMVARNFRSRYPLSSQLLTDQMDEVYNGIVDLLGYQNVSGVIAVSGFLRESISVVETHRLAVFGSPASGYDSSFALSSGVMDSVLCSGSMLMSELMGYWASPF